MANTEILILIVQSAKVQYRYVAKGCKQIEGITGTTQKLFQQQRAWNQREHQCKLYSTNDHYIKWTSKMPTFMPQLRNNFTFTQPTDYEVGDKV